MTSVINKAGTEIDFESVFYLMDDDIREDLSREGIEDDQEFFTAYEHAHELKYGEEWELSKANPTW